MWRMLSLLGWVTSILTSSRLAEYCSKVKNPSKSIPCTWFITFQYRPIPLCSDTYCVLTWQLFKGWMDVHQMLCGDALLQYDRYMNWLDIWRPKIWRWSTFCLCDNFWKDGWMWMCTKSFVLQAYNFGSWRPFHRFGFTVAVAVINAWLIIAAPLPSYLAIWLLCN